MSEQRYQCWAGVSHENYLDVMASILDGSRQDWIKKVKEMRFETIWPVIDNETCGQIEGFPKPNQMMCFCFDPKDQARVAKAMNQLDQLEKIARSIPPHDFKEDDFDFTFDKE